VTQTHIAERTEIQKLTYLCAEQQQEIKALQDEVERLSVKNMD